METIRNQTQHQMKKGAHKLTKSDILTIWTMYNEGMNHHQISREFVSTRKQKVSRRHIGSILNGQRWKQETNELKEKLTDTK